MKNKIINLKKNLSTRGKAFLLIILFLAASEIVLRICVKNYRIAPQIFKEISSPPEYRLAPNTNCKCFQSDKYISISIDANGNRLVPNASTSSFAKYVHLIGDSQIFGWGLSDTETIAFQLQKSLGSGFRVVNHGVPGYGPYAYSKILNSISTDDWVVIVHTEQNDLWDAYSAKAKAVVRCNILASETFLGKNLSCLTSNILSFQYFSLLSLKYIYNQRALPLQFNPKAKVASNILLYRIQKLYQEQKQLRGAKLIFTYIPWEGVLDSKRVSKYLPKIQKPVRLIKFQDDCNIEQTFLQAEHPESLYLLYDEHLSFLGAKQVALIIYYTLQQRNTSS